MTPPMGATFNNVNQLQTRAARRRARPSAGRRTSRPRSRSLASRRRPPSTTAFSGPGRRSAPARLTWSWLRRTPRETYGQTRTASAPRAHGVTYMYDSNGNLTAKTEGTDTWGYEWNADNELTRVTKNSVEQARFSLRPAREAESRRSQGA